MKKTLTNLKLLLQSLLKKMKKKRKNYLVKASQIGTKRSSTITSDDERNMAEMTSKWYYMKCHRKLEKK
jgi:vacuolar-type H+-ATPase subunit H